MQRALVTGASGFIGQVLCRVLSSRGVEVTALSRRPGHGPWRRAVPLDLAREEVPTALLERLDAVFHLAGHAHAQDEPWAAEVHQQVSVDGTARLLAACPDGIRLVYASSVKAMGEATPAGCLDEDAPPVPVTAYGRARLQAETQVLSAASRLHSAVVRLPLVYGPGVKGNLEVMMNAVDRRRLPLFPDWKNHRSLVHVEDACEALVAAASTHGARGRVYLVTDGHDYSTREIQRLMYQASGRAPPSWTMPAWALCALALVGDVAGAVGLRKVPINGPALSRLRGDACFDCSRARRELGFAPHHDLASALPAMFQALRADAMRGRA